MQNEQWVNSTRQQALYLWVGMSLSLTLFFTVSQMIFVKAEPIATSSLELIFSALGAVTFLLGLYFFRNYTTLKKNEMSKMPPEQRKQQLLVAFVMQFVLFETLGMYGIFLSVLTQNTWKALPFIIFAYLGFIVGFPKREKIKVFF